MPLNASAQKIDILEGNHEFDMRKLHTYSLINPSDKLMPLPGQDPEELQLIKENTIYEFEKDDPHFEVLEVLIPTELVIRIKVYDKQNFLMLTSCDIAESILREELQKDQRSNLLGPQKREDLAKYLIVNSFYDDRQKSLKFMESELVEDV